MSETVEIIIETALGRIKGLQKAAHQDFLGIRYARAPLGQLRFQPPVRIDAWEGVYDACHYGPMAPQAYPDTPPIRLEESEDCLLLNIHTPAADGQARPVMVYIHGGGFLIDSGSRPRTYGGPLCECGDVVVVTIEYRMGAFGFLFADGIPPNLGLQDQVCALEWVRRHIADFGGDPANVTIFGESAGATSVAYLLVMPSAQGLFHKAILESGAFPLESLQQNLRFARNGTRRFFNQLKLEPGDLPGLQKVAYADIIKAEKRTAGQLLFTDRAFYPALDGNVIPQDIYGTLRNGISRDIPIIIGVNGEELPIFGAFVKGGLKSAVVKAAMLRQLRQTGATGSQVKALVQLYRRSLSADGRGPDKGYNQLFSDETFRVPATLFAEAHIAGGGKVYFYCFSHPAPCIGVACHVLEVYFVFGTLQSEDIADMMKVPGTADELQLSQDMMKAWTAFARSGNPSHAGIPAWQPYDMETRPTMYLDVRSELVQRPAEAVRDAWMEIARGLLGG